MAVRARIVENVNAFWRDNLLGRFDYYFLLLPIQIPRDRKRSCTALG
jgi:hypothetical protein